MTRDQAAVGRSRRRGYGVLVAVAVGLLAAAAPTAQAAPPPAGSFSITPAESVLTSRPPLTLSPTAVSNTTDGGLDVLAYPVLLTQQRSGAFSFSSTPTALQTARAILAVSPARFVLPAQSVRSVSLQWKSTPHHRSSYIGVVYQAVAAGSSTAVHTVERLLGVDLLSVPGAAPARGVISAVQVGEPTKGALRFTLAVRNLGASAGDPRTLALHIKGATARHAVVLHLSPAVVFPGATREFVLETHRRLAPGSFTVTAELGMGATGRARKTAGFTIDANGSLPTPALSVGALQVSGEVGSGAGVHVRVKSIGSAPATVRASIAIYLLKGGLPAAHAIATRRVLAGPLAPGTAKTISATLGKLGPDSYEAVVTYGSPIRALQPAVVDFQARTPRSFTAEAGRWLSAHAMELALAAALLACAALLTIVLRQSSRAGGEDVRRPRLPER
jgi:hypothetical protein